MAMNYSQLITKVIENFDEIYTIIRNKGANDLEGGDLAASGSTGVSTDDYANIISKYLYRIDKLDSSTLGTGIIANKQGAQTTGTIAVNYNTKKLVISNLAAGYYDTSSVLTTGTDGLFVDVGLSNFSPVKTGDVITGYEIVPTDKIISKVSLAAGSLSNELTIGAGTETNAPLLGGSHDLVLGTDGPAVSESAIADGFSFQVSCTPSITGKIDVTAKADASAGLFAADASNTKTGSFDLSGIKGSAATSTYYLGKSTSTISEVKAHASLNSGDLELGSSAADGYAISATVLKPTVNVTVGEGYTKGGSVNTVADGAYTGTGDTVYIKHGKVEQKTTDKASVSTTSNIVASVTDAAEEGKVSIEVKAAATTVNLTTTEGYVKSTDVTSVTVGADTKYLNLNKASGAIGVTAATASSDSALLTTSGSRKVTVSVTPTLSKSVTAGYLSSESEITATSGTFNTDLYIKEGSVAATNNVLSITGVEYDETGKAIANPALTDIFSTAVPAKSDYFKIQANASTVVGEGYVAGQTATGASTAYYIPRAKLKFVEAGGDNGENLLEVEQSGYLPSGLITNIAEITGTLDAAAVSVVVDNNGGINFVNAGGEGKYTITLKAGSIDAGFISSTKGTVSGEVYIDHASAGTTAEITKVEKGAIAWNSEKNTYDLAFTATGAVKTNVSEGYIKPTDLTVNGETGKNNTDVALTKTGTLSIDKAVVALASSSISGTVATEGLETVETSKYVVTPTIGGDTGNAALEITTTSAGYLGVGDKAAATVSLGDVQSIYIKAGTQLKTVNGAGKVTIKNNFAESVTGDYTISLNGANTIAVAGQLATGYYGDENERAVSGTATINGIEGAVTVAHGKVGLTGLQTNLGITGSEIVIAKNIAQENTSAYYQITPTATDGMVTRSVTEGYVKSGDVKDEFTTVTNGSSDKFYIGKYAASTYIGEDGATASANDVDAAYLGISGFGIKDGANVDFEIIETANKYSTKNIGITLHEDAAGKGVRDSLALLEERLAGDNVKSLSLA